MSEIPTISPYGNRKVLLLCGILASLIWMASDVLAALRYEGYNYPFQVISDLTAIGAPTRSFVNSLFFLYVALKIVFACGLYISASQKRWIRITAGLLFTWGIIDLAASLFPWNPNEAVGAFANRMHAILAGGLPVILILLTIGFGANAGGKGFRFYSYGTLLVLFVSGVMMSLGKPQIDLNQPPPSWFGLTERINAYGFMLWMMALAIIRLRTQQESVSREGRGRIIHPDKASNRI